MFTCKDNFNLSPVIDAAQEIAKIEISFRQPHMVNAIHILSKIKLIF